MVCKPLRIKPPLFRRRVGFFTHNRAFNLEKAQTRLGYRSTWNHRDGIRQTIQWYRDNQLV
jgi:nucleoside-diphosphate-sugar epimerase